MEDMRIEEEGDAGDAAAPASGSGEAGKPAKPGEAEIREDEEVEEAGAEDGREDEEGGVVGGERTEGAGAGNPEEEGEVAGDSAEEFPTEQRCGDVEVTSPEEAEELMKSDCVSFRSIVVASEDLEDLAFLANVRDVEDLLVIKGCPHLKVTV